MQRADQTWSHPIVERATGWRPLATAELTERELEAIAAGGLFGGSEVIGKSGLLNPILRLGNGKIIV